MHVLVVLHRYRLSMKRALEADRTWGEAMHRQRIVLRFELLAAPTSEHACPPAVGETARRLVSRALARARSGIAKIAGNFCASSTLVGLQDRTCRVQT
jgi:hypothetical protein